MTCFTYYSLITLLVYNVVIRECWAAETNLVKYKARQFFITFQPSACYILDALHKCADLCLRSSNCSSVDYQEYSGICYQFEDDENQLYGYSYNLVDHVFVAMSDYKRVRANDPCRDKPCRLGQQCLPNKQSYICQDIEYKCVDSLVRGYLGIPPGRMSASTSTIPVTVTIINLWSKTGWEPTINDTYPYIQVHFTRFNFIHGIATRGLGDKDAWVTSYKVLYSIDCVNFDYILDRNGEQKIFAGNVDRNSKHTIFFGAVYRAKCVHIEPVTFSTSIGLRFEIYGCCNRWRNGILLKNDN